MKPITVKEAAEYLTALSKNGLGEKIIVVSDDEEVNGVHPLFGEFIRDKKGVTVIEDDEIIYLDAKKNKKEVGQTILLY